MNTPSITTWLHGMQRGDHDAEWHLWQACWKPVVSRARAMLAQRHRVVSDEEDVAASVLESLFRRAQAGEFSALNGSNDLWRLLWVIVERKVANHVEHDVAQCRNVRRTKYFSEIADAATLAEAPQPESRVPDLGHGEPFEAVMLAETLEQLLRQLTAPMRQTLQLALNGQKPKEIAHSLGLKVWTVYNHLAHIRSLLEQGLIP